MESALQQNIISAGTQMRTGGNKPFLITGDESIWYVLSGQVEVFIVDLADGEPAGARNYFCTVQPGELFWGTAPEDSPVEPGMLAVPAANTELIYFGRDVFSDLLAEEALHNEIANAVDPWVKGLSTGVSQDINPRKDVVIAADNQYTLEAGKNFKAGKGVVWCSFSKGTPIFIGVDEVEAVEDGACFPISSDSWMQALNELEFTTRTTRDVIAQGMLQQSVELFLQTALRCELLNRRFARVDEMNLINEQVEFKDNLRRKAYSHLASILQPEQRTTSLHHSDKVLNACRIIGDYLDVEIKPHPDTDKGETIIDPLSGIVKASKIKYRKVLLRGAWWKSAPVPLLAYLEEKHAPVALIPDSPSSFTMYDGDGKEQGKVTEENYQQFKFEAYEFYKPFPDRPISVTEMFKLGFERTGADLWRLAVFGMLAGLLGLAVPLMVGYLFDTVIPRTHMDTLYVVAAALAGAAIAIALFEVVRGVAMLRFQSKLDSQVQPAVWDRLLKLPVSFFQKYNSGDLASRAMGINRIRQLLSSNAIFSLLGLVFSSFNLAILFYYEAFIASIILAVIVVAISVTFIGKWYQLHYYRDITNLEGSIAGQVLQYISGILKLRAASAEVPAFTAWADKFSQQRNLQFKARNIEIYFDTLLMAVPLTLLLLLIVLAPVGDPSFTAGDFAAFYTAMAAFIGIMVRMNASLSEFIQVVPVYERLKPIIETPLEVDEAKTDPGEFAGNIEVSNISFAYNPQAPKALDNISVNIKPGEFVAFAGASGSGKSTLLKMMLGFITPNQGSILYDGKDLSTLDLGAVRNQIGVVLQNSKLMHGTIGSNIIGAKPLTLDDAWEAAETVGMKKEIKDLPMGMMTLISSGLSTFSGGQTQRLLLARAIASKPKVIFLDEATSALDNKTQEAVARNLENLQATRVVIAHRLSTIVNADRIYVMEHGQVVQQGTYEELVNVPGVFSDLVKRQIAEQSIL